MHTVLGTPQSDFNHTFPSPVYKWETKYQVACGTGQRAPES